MSTDPTLSQPIVGPAELVQAIPYLLGFHPLRSLVLVGLANGTLVVTARLDLADARIAEVVFETAAALQRGGSREIVAAVYDDADEPEPGADPRPGRLHYADRVEDAAAPIGCSVLDVLLVLGDRWWSLRCASPNCCPRIGRAVLGEPSAFAAAATYSGRVALPDRSAVERLLDPLPDHERVALEPALAECENAAVDAVLDATAHRRERSSKRALFAAARAAAEPAWPGVTDEEAVRFGVALTELAVRDAVWMAVDDGRLDGRPLWRELGRRLPSPYDAAPLFLFGWAAWRSGDGALAGIAAERAVASDAEYSAADLLLAALARGVDPRRLPRLRLPRSA
jgi:hypothetical protein